MSSTYIYNTPIYKTLICGIFNSSGGISMSQGQDNFKRGTAELLILYLLQEEDLYGYQITKLFNDKSNGIYKMVEGSLYPILFRLVEAGYISDYEKLVGAKRKRRYYHLKDSGKVYFQQLLRDFDEICFAINSILDREVTINEE